MVFRSFTGENIRGRRSILIYQPTSGRVSVYSCWEHLIHDRIRSKYYQISIEDPTNNPMGTNGICTKDCSNEYPNQNTYSNPNQNTYSHPNQNANTSSRRYAPDE